MKGKRRGEEKRKRGNLQGDTGKCGTMERGKKKKKKKKKKIHDR